jgi:hypothetical protein
MFFFSNSSCSYEHLYNSSFSNSKNAKKIQANLQKTENNRQEVKLKPHVCLLSFGPQMDHCGPQKMVYGALVLGCMVCDLKLTIYGPHILTLAPDFIVLLVTFSSDVRFASNLCRSSLFSMSFYLILKIIKSR